MIDSQKLKEFVEQRLAEAGYFLVSLSVSADNDITIEIDSLTGVDIDYCAELTREIEAEFDRDADDYSLEVGSAGLTAPFRVRGQYEKNLGNEVEVLTTDGRKLRGTLKALGAADFTLSVEQKVKREGQKRPAIETTDITSPFTETKYTKYLLDF